MPSDRPRPHYVSYLLRLWQTEHKGEFVWRASLESPGTGERQGFDSLAGLCAFLERETERVNRDGSQSPESGACGQQG